MKEEMLKVLNDESLTTNEARVDAMARAMATLVIPKDKFNEESAKRKKAEEDLANLSAKITQEPPKEEPKQDERVVGLENEIKNLRIESNRAKVEKIFSQAGLEENDYKEDLDRLKNATNEFDLSFSDLKDTQLNIKCLVYTMPSEKFGDKKPVSFTKSNNAFRTVQLMDKNGQIIKRRLANDFCEKIENGGSTIVNVSVTPESQRFFVCKEADTIQTINKMGDTSRYKKNRDDSQMDTDKLLQEMHMNMEKKVLTDLPEEECIEEI